MHELSQALASPAAWEEPDRAARLAPRLPEETVAELRTVIRGLDEQNALLRQQVATLQARRSDNLAAQGGNLVARAPR